MKKEFFITIALILMLAPLIYGAVLIDRVVAVVDDEPITWSELYKRTEFELSDQIANLPPEQKRQTILKHQPEVLGRMIDEIILSKEAQKAGVYVKDSEVEEALKSIARRNNLSVSQFKEILRQRGISLEFYKDILRQQILVQRYETLQLKDRITLTEKEIEEYLRKKGISPEEGEAVVLRQIYVPLSDDAEKTVSEAMEALSSGMAFEEVARQYSKGPLARFGGLLGQVKVEELSEPLREALKGLSEGQYSGPIRTDRGTIILYLEKRLPTYEAYKKQAQEELFYLKLSSLRQAWISELRKEHFIETRL